MVELRQVHCNNITLILWVHVYYIMYQMILLLLEKESMKQSRFVRLLSCRWLPVHCDESQDKYKHHEAKI